MLCLLGLQGAATGLITSLLLLLWIGIGAQVAKAQGFLKVPHKPYSTEGCPFNNETMANFTSSPTDFTTTDWNWETTTSLPL